MSRRRHSARHEQRHDKPLRLFLERRERLAARELDADADLAPRREPLLDLDLRAEPTRGDYSPIHE